MVVAKTRLRLCSAKAGQCSQCSQLHLCRFVVCGQCRFGNSCKNSHSLSSGKNQEILKSQGLQDLTERQLFQLLLQNNPRLLPEVCPHYNKGDGLHGSCKFSTSCTKLHICQHFLQGDCAFGTSCKRAHHFHVNKQLFQCFSCENVENLFQIYRNKFIIEGQGERRASEFPGRLLPPAVPQTLGGATRRPLSSKPKPASAPKPASDADKNEICLFFIRKNCSFKEKCARVHWHLPYRWQVSDSDGVTWTDLPDMEEIERAYCDPRQENSSTEHSEATTSQSAVDFLTMTFKSRPVRRLSTASSVSKPPHFILTTEWLWYWRNDTGQWLEFGQVRQKDADAQASITPSMLEKLYWADRDGEVPFCAGNQQYILHFAGEETQMYQQNLKYQTKRKIRRRPRFVSADEVAIKLKSAASPSAGSSTAESLPQYWDKNDHPGCDYKLIQLSKSAEYNRIETLFKRTMPNSTIHQIQRIQNPSLWRVFEWQKEQMTKKNEGKSVNQLYLFHGTDESLVEAICEQNFDWRVCGTHGTVYGKGSYFAKDASYSDQYSRISSRRNKIMFVALVLVGDSTQGRSSYVRPPPKGNSKAFYDSCVNSESNPSIYVIFEKQQIYPEYLINYS
uniref:Poly (ADP-ribose) polymerase family, member 12a n=1 Tax=Tetraodon nigroviridis TaxID=99883 RepID=H3CSH7_TETNG